MRNLWLADVLRDAGLQVVETSGWRTRGEEYVHAIDGVIGHHTASRKTSGNLPSLKTCINGRADLEGPLCSVLGGRDGSVAIVASGIGNHAGAGYWPGIRYGNRSTIGFEWENDGIGEPWSARTMESYEIAVAAVEDYLDLPTERFCSHYEWARPVGRKIDPAGPWVGGGDWYSGGSRPSWSARTFRARVEERRGDMFTQEDRDRAIRIEEKLDSFFGVNPDGTARDIRAKIDSSWTALYGDDHPELIAGRVKALADGSLPLDT